MVGEGNSYSNSAPQQLDSHEKAENGEQEFSFFRATVEILDIDIRTNGKVLYTAKVIASENADLQVDSEIKIISPVVETGGAVTLEEAQTYDLMLCEEQSDDSGEEKAFLLVNETVE